MATKRIAWTTGSGNITLTYTGQGNGTITVESDENNLGAARSQIVSIHTTDNVKTKNLTVNQAACPFPVGDTKNYSYTGSYQEVELPAGQYKLQCWGAQGGSNGANSTYGITAQAGGKGGYSEGIITLSQKTTVRVYVGGQGSSSAGGFNGGGSTTGTSQYNASNDLGYSKMGGGGGATDIRLSDGALLSRMIVAGGGAGGAMAYRSNTTTTTTSVSFASSNLKYDGYYLETNGTPTAANNWCITKPIYLKAGDTISGTAKGYGPVIYLAKTNSSGSSYTAILTSNSSSSTWPFTYTATSNMYVAISTAKSGSSASVTSTTTTTSTNAEVGGVGGGLMGGGYSLTYVGYVNEAGTGGSFGIGANQTTTNYRFASAGGGGGWYGGGGGQKSNATIIYVKYSGGGSGFVNIAANAQYRPTGYTGLQLDSGETKDGATSFPNTAGTGNETGHSGNGYARITRLA